MRLSKPLLQLPICFDADRLAAEVNALASVGLAAASDRLCGE